MKILKISHSYYPENNTGVEVYVDALSNALSGKNKIMLFTQSKFVKEPTVKYDGAYQIYAVPYKSSAKIKLAHLKKCIKTFQPDVVHIHHLHDMGLSIPIYLMQSNMPYVVTLHDYWFICGRIRLINSAGELCDYPYDGCASCMYPRKFIKRSIFKFGHAKRNRKALSVLNNAAYIFTPSNLIKKRFLEFGVINENFEVMQLGIDVNCIIKKLKHNRNKANIKLGFIGTIGIFKGIEILVKAFKSLDVPNELFLYGKVYAKDEVALQKIFNNDSRLILKGEFDHHNIGEVLNQIDILLVPSLCEETHCLVIDEARCAEIPVIASRIGSIPDRITDGDNGFLVEPGNVEMLKEKIEILLTDYDRIVSGMDFKRNLATIENNAEYHEGVYRRILKGEKGLTVCTKQAESDIALGQCPFCYLCGGKSTILYEDLHDALFDVKGRWNFRRCYNDHCGLIWLDPRPEERDLGALYIKYYTHDEEHDTHSQDIGMRFSKWIFRLPYSLFRRVTLIRRQRQRLSLMFLDQRSPGRLLEIGCGNGSRLAMLRKLGWEVEGQEIDPQAALQGEKKYDLRIHMGTLESLGLPDDTYDAVILNHVLEHVYDPVKLLSECRRVMKPHGVLTAVTPNASSYGHSYFLSHWRGLEPPRHLHLFSCENLQQIAEKAGFFRLKIWTTAARAESFARGSLQLCSRSQTQGKRLTDLGVEVQAMLFHVRAWAVHRRKPFTGEECVLKAFKKD